MSPGNVAWDLNGIKKKNWVSVVNSSRARGLGLIADNETELTTSRVNSQNYIPLNNEQNEPTQRDIGEISNDPTQAKRLEFKELYASANEELYLGCDYVTRLDFMTKFTYFKVKGKLTDFIFNEMLEFFQNVFPTAKGYKHPSSYYAIKKTFKMIRLGYKLIHACVNDCFLFRGDANKDVHFCPVCNTSRWKDGNTPGKKVPKKVLRYFFIIPRLQRLYKSSHTAKEMTWYATGKCTEPDKMQHSVDESSFMLTLLIPGPKSLGKDIDVYLRPLIADLKDLWAKPGVETIDVATGLKFNMRVMVLWTINDFPARSNVSGLSGQGLQQYLPLDVAKPLIELCLFFKQIYSQTLMVGDMLKAQSKVIDIMCNLELIYPPAFFDIMIYLVIHLPLEAIGGGPIHPRQMYPFERFMKKIKNYVRNKSKPEGSIAKGNVAKEALTFSSNYFWNITMKFNHPELNVDCPPPTYQFQVFKSLCKLICLQSVIRIDHQELKKMICRDERRTTQNSGICSLGPDGEMYYEDDPDVIHVDNSSDLALSTSLNDFEIVALHIDGQPIDVDTPSDIIDVDEDDDIIDEEDPITHNLADSDDEDLVNLDIDYGVNVVCSSEEED
nr:hypothetical protein [Tanacetum cinerariifolium]